MPSSFRRTTSQTAEKAGSKPDVRATLLQLRAYRTSAGNEQGAQTTLEKLVRHYPEPDTGPG